MSSPILMDNDFPRVSPEDARDLFDATEIAESLSWRTLMLTEEQKRVSRPPTPGRWRLSVGRGAAMQVPERRQILSVARAGSWLAGVGHRHPVRAV
jgi:hypothetical protein